MKSFALLAYFMAFLAIFCGTSHAKTARLERRAPPVIPFPLPDKVNAVIDVLLQEQLTVISNAYANVCTDADIDSTVKSNLRFTVTGLGLNFDVGLTSKLTAQIDAAIKAQVKATVHSEINGELSANLKADIQNVLFTQCPLGDLACIKLKANIIVKSTVDLAISAATKISANLHTKLKTDIEAAIKAEVKKFSVNLWLVKVNVTGGVEINSALSLKFKAAVEASQKVLLSVRAKIVSKIRAIYE